MRYIWFLAICMTLAVGGFFCNNPKYSYEPGCYAGHLETIQEHLQTIAQNLKTYNARNNRYPDNNEGLTVLTELRDQLREKQYHLPPPLGSYNYRGQPPPFSRRETRDMFSFEGGILSPWLEPFLYENRRSLSADLFADSPATRDAAGHYSIKVDEDIYVYSAGAMLFYKEYQSLLIEMWSLRIFIWLLLAFLVYKAVRAKEPAIPPKRWYLKILKIVGAPVLLLASLFFGFAVNMTTCYVMSSFNLHRRPAMTAESLARLDQYRQRGVINQATYDKAKQALAQVDNLINQK